MTQGIFIDGKRPTSKKQVREAIAKMRASTKQPYPRPYVTIEATSQWDLNGSITMLPAGTYFFVVPSPAERESFGNIEVRQDGKIIVK